MRPSVPGGQSLACASSSSKLVSGAVALRSHVSDPAAESITPMACQAPGIAWQKACTRASGSAANASSAANTTPEVPSATETGPWPVDPDAERTGGLVAGAGRDGRSVPGLARGTSGLSSTGGSQSG